MTRACRPLTAWRRLAAPLCAAALLVPAPAAADTCSGLAFGTQAAGATGTAPAAVVVADFNRDGKADVVTATLPVAGTSITMSSLYGRWSVEPHLDGQPGPCGPAARFTIRD